MIMKQQNDVIAEARSKGMEYEQATSCKRHGGRGPGHLTCKPPGADGFSLRHH